MSLLRWRLHATLYLEAGDYDAERGEAALTLRTLKVRDAERPAPLRLVRRRVELAAWHAQGAATARDRVHHVTLQPDTTAQHAL